MALSDDLKRVYSSNTIDVRSYDTVELSHSLFTQTYYLINDPVPQILEISAGVSKTFTPFAFSVSLPTKGSNQQEIGLVFDNVAQIGITEIELASGNMKEPIKMIYRVYIDGDITSQIDPIELELTSVSATAISITATATRTNLYAKKVPTRNFDSWVFLGLK